MVGSRGWRRERRRLPRRQQRRPVRPGGALVRIAGHSREAAPLSHRARGAGSVASTGHRGEIRVTRLASASRLPMRCQPAISLRSRSERISSFVSRKEDGRSALSPIRPVRAGERASDVLSRCRLAVSTLTILRRRDGRRLELRGTPATFHSVSL